MIPTSMEQFTNSMGLWLALQNTHLQGRPIPGVNFPNPEPKRNQKELNNHESDNNELKEDKAKGNNFVGMMTNEEENNEEDDMHMVSNIGYKHYSMPQVYQTKSNEPKSLFLINSGATCHFTNDKADLIGCMPVHTKITITENSVCWAKKAGTQQLEI